MPPESPEIVTRFLSALALAGSLAGPALSQDTALLPLARRRALVLDPGRTHRDRRQRRVLRQRRSGETARKRER